MGLFILSCLFYGDDGVPVVFVSQDAVDAQGFLTFLAKGFILLVWVLGAAEDRFGLNE